MTKVLIVSVPVQDIAKPPGILSILAGCCESISVDYETLDLNLRMYKTLPENIAIELTNDFLVNRFRSLQNQNYYDTLCDHVIDQINKHNITHVAISVFTYASILATYQLIRRIRLAKCNCTIIIGGLGIYKGIVSITNGKDFGQFCLDNKLVDYCIFGEGDIAFVELLKNNVTYPGINQSNGLQINDLNSLPLLSYRKINPSDYYYATSPEVIVTGSRGCVRDCTFCDVGHWWPKYVFKSGERMAQELFKIWTDTGVNQFDFSDSLINGSIKSFRQFNKELIKLKAANPEFKPGYKGQFICRPSNQLTEQDYIDMSLAGAETLVVGIESFSESVRNHMRKKFDNNSIDWHFEMCAKYNIKNLLLLLSGYVTETIDDHNTTLEYLKKYQIYALSRVIYAINIAIGGLDLLDGTPLHAMQDELGLIPLSPNEPLHYDNWISTKNITLTPHERLRRGVETVYLANSLGYKVAHFNSKVDFAQQQLEVVMSAPSSKIFKLEVVNRN
jgi:radical SAM superfamily enzyme YgiQ (UPF0313 family)